MNNQTDTDNGQRLELYDKTRDDLLKRQLSNSENADRAVLTVSTAALGFSLAFLKDLVPIATASCSWLLYLSWLLFVLAIIITLASFFSSQKAIDEQLRLAELYYLNQHDHANDKLPRFAIITIWLNRIGATIFVVGILMTCIFAAINLGKEVPMVERKLMNEGGGERRGAVIPSMQPVVPQTGAPIPAIPKAPTSVPPPASTNQKPGGK